MRQAPHVPHVRAEAAEGQRTGESGSVADEHHAVGGGAFPHALPAVMMHARDVAEHRLLHAPLRARAFIGWQRLEVFLKQREQGFVGGRVHRVVEEEVGRVFVARRRAGEALPDELSVIARVLGADENLADLKSTLSGSGPRTKPRATVPTVGQTCVSGRPSLIWRATGERCRSRPRRGAPRKLCARRARREFPPTRGRPRRSSGRGAFRPRARTRRRQALAYFAAASWSSLSASRATSSTPLIHSGSALTRDAAS